jgi:hypothetical protein
LADNYKKAQDEQKRHNEERYEELVAARNKELEELGRSLSKEKDITEEGMQAIAEKISEVFGENAAGDALIRGWTERTSTEFGQLIAELEEQINGLADTAASVTEKIKTGKSPDPYGGTTPGDSPYSDTVNMREGGVITGPATVFVEPGVREAYIPLPAQPSLNVNMSGGFNISGGEMAGKVEVEAALRQMTEDFSLSIKRLKRRG